MHTTFACHSEKETNPLYDEAKPPTRRPQSSGHNSRHKTRRLTQTIFNFNGTDDIMQQFLLTRLRRAATDVENRGMSADVATVGGQVVDTYNFGFIGSR